MYSEGSDVALQHFTSLKLLTRIVQCLDQSRFPVNSVLVAAQCLQTVSEDNPVLAAEFASNATFVQGMKYMWHYNTMTFDVDHFWCLSVCFS